MYDPDYEEEYEPFYESYTYTEYKDDDVEKDEEHDDVEKDEEHDDVEKDEEHDDVEKDEEYDDEVYRVEKDDGCNLIYEFDLGTLKNPEHRAMYCIFCGNNGGAMAQNPFDPDMCSKLTKC